MSDLDIMLILLTSMGINRSTKRTQPSSTSLTATLEPHLLTHIRPADETERCCLDAFKAGYRHVSIHSQSDEPIYHYFEPR